MKKEYDFSSWVRGKFYRESVRLNLPIYPDKDIADFVQKVAKQKKINSQTVVNTILRANKKNYPSFAVVLFISFFPPNQSPKSRLRRDGAFVLSVRQYYFLTN